jgi:DNA topoisomerase-2
MLILVISINLTDSQSLTNNTLVADQIVTQLIEAVKKKDKKGAPVKPFQAKNHLWLFVNCLVENPTFDSQTEETMTLRASAFGSKFSVSEDFMKKGNPFCSTVEFESHLNISDTTVMKSGVVENILKFVHFKESQMLKKTDGAKKSRISGIVKLGMPYIIFSAMQFLD